MGEAVGRDLALRRLLDPIIADGLGGIERRPDLRLRQRLDEPRRLGVVRPDPGIAVGLELGPDGSSSRAGVVAARLQVTEQVLDVVAVLVGDDVGARKGRIGGAEPVVELLEEPEIEIDVLVDGAVERPGR